ncbi:hypothetical protein GCM10027093_04060 [Paraburkholderia jirisanensis]
MKSQTPFSSLVLVTPAKHPSPRKPRNIVTVSGRGARGYLPIRKATMAAFESLVEQMAFYVLEVAPSVKSIATQPRVFEYTDGTRRRRYTPDVEIEVENGATKETALLEVKDDDNFTPNSEAAARLRAALPYLRQRGERLHIVLRSDLITNALDQQLARLLRQRPRRIKFRTDIDPTLWDPEMGTLPSPEIQQQWEDAKRQCDDLLRRIMNRDPDDLLSVCTR